MLVENRKAYRNFDVLERFTAGVELFGFEVKALRKGQATLSGARVTVRGKEGYLLGMNVSPLQPKNVPETYDPLRARRLLLTKKELVTLSDAEDKKGFALIPLSFFLGGRKIKCEIAIARGKKKYDKRETIKKRDTARDVRREFKRELS